MSQKKCIVKKASNWGHFRLRAPFWHCASVLTLPYIYHPQTCIGLLGVIGKASSTIGVAFEPPPDLPGVARRPSLWPSPTFSNDEASSRPSIMFKHTIVLANVVEKENMSGNEGLTLGGGQHGEEQRWDDILDEFKFKL